MDDRIDALADDFAAAEAAAALTGAGVSTASGIPDFRSDDGLWSEYDERDFSLPAFRREPGAFWERWVETHDAMLGDDVAPNAAHEALADLEAAGHLDGVVTQNVDGLHREAGSETVVSLHGRGDRAVCRDCGAREGIDAPMARSSEGIDGPMTRAREGELPPRCQDCDGRLKPDTVLFGERLPEHARLRADKLAQDADVFLAVGSSLTVEPAASLPLTAARHGAAVAVVNMDDTQHDDRADHVFHADVTEVLPALVEAVERRDVGGADG